MRVAAIVLLLGYSSLAAATEVDPRYAYTLELATGPTISVDLAATGAQPMRAMFRLQFFAPIAENVKLGGGPYVSSSERGAAGGVRSLGEFDEWQTRLDLQLAMSVQPRFGIGLRVGAGVARELRPGLRAGLEISASFLAVRLRFTLEPALFASYAW